MIELKQVPVDETVAREMLLRADAAKANTYPESGGYAVCVLSDQGNVYEGISYKSATLTLTMHSEATALANAAIHGEKNIIAITGPNCHICKQLIWESALQSGIDVQVIIPDGDTVTFVPISEMMPYPWPGEDGSK